MDLVLESYLREPSYNHVKHQANLYEALFFPFDKGDKSWRQSQWLVYRLLLAISYSVYIKKTDLKREPLQFSVKGINVTGINYHFRSKDKHGRQIPERVQIIICTKGFWFGRKTDGSLSYLHSMHTPHIFWPWPMR